MTKSDKIIIENYQELMGYSLDIIRIIATLRALNTEVIEPATKDRPMENNIIRDQYIIISSSLFYTAISEWCKIFCDNKENHTYYKKYIKDPRFQCEFLDCLELKNEEWKKYTEDMKTYRDKLIAHTDKNAYKKVETHPFLDVALKSISFCHDFVSEEITDHYHSNNRNFSIPCHKIELTGSRRRSAKDIYDLYLNEGIRHWRRAYLSIYSRLSG